MLSEPRKVYDKNSIRVRKKKPPKKPKVGISRNDDAGFATREAVKRIGGMCKFVKKDDLVGIKINITGGHSKNRSSFTSPEVTKEVVEMVRECGGKPVVFDSSMIWTDMEPIAEKEGWYDWAEKNTVQVADLHHLPVVPFDFGDDGVMRMDKASTLVKDIDVLINVPKMKTHMLTTVTIGMKNNYGLLPRADKGVYHAKDIDTVVAEVNQAFPSTLTIVDGTIAGEGEAGPLTPDPIKDYNTVIASNDVVCADAVAAKFMGFDNPMQIRHLKMGTLLGVGDARCYRKDNVKKEIDLHFGSHPKDGKFRVPDPRVIESLSDFTKVMARGPGGASLMDNFSDMFLGNLSYYTSGFMKNLLSGFTAMQKRYIGKDFMGMVNPHGLNLHPEDHSDAGLY